MSYSVSSPAMQSLMAARTAKVWLHLLTIMDSELNVIKRMVDNTTNITSRGNVFERFAFKPQIPAESEGSMPKVEIMIDNVGQELTATIETLVAPPVIYLEVILADTPDVIERGPFKFKLRSVSYNRLTIRSELTYEELTAEPYPYKRFTPTAFPGLFNAVDR